MRRFVLATLLTVIAVPTAARAQSADAVPAPSSTATTTTTTAPPPSGAVAVQPAATVAAPGAVYVQPGVYYVAPRPPRRRHPGLPLIIAGASMLGGGYLLGLPVSFLGWQAWGLIPVAGSYIAGVGAFVLAGSATNTRYAPTAGYFVAMGSLNIAMGLVQTAGLVTLIVGLARREPPATTAAGATASRAARWTLSPGAAGADMGLSFSLTHF